MKAYLARLKTRAYRITETGKRGDTLSVAFDVLIISLILLNVVAITLETVEGLYQRHEVVFAAFEVFSVVIFSVEYLLRLWCCTENPKYRHPFTGRLRFFFTPLALIDLLAILPAYLTLFGVDLLYLRVLRMLRILRVAKLARYSPALRSFLWVMARKKEELAVSMALMFFLLIIASAAMYYVEHDSQPAVFSSIPAAMWWGVATLSTVGYGDVYPVTELGKVLASFIAVLGIGLFGLPAGIIGSGFVEEIGKRRTSKAGICPHCGRGE